MTERIIRAALLVVAVAASISPASIAQDGEPEASEATLLFVIEADGGSADGSTLTLDGVSSVIWFTDRPQRSAGHVPPAILAERWAAGDDSFADDPPNAVLSVHGDGTPADAVITLAGVDLDGATLSFEVELIDGELPTGSFGSSSLFIDSIFTDIADWFVDRGECVAKAPYPGVDTIILGCGS